VLIELVHSQKLTTVAFDFPVCTGIEVAVDVQLHALDTTPVWTAVRRGIHLHEHEILAVHIFLPITPIL